MLEIQVKFVRSVQGIVNGEFVLEICDSTQTTILTGEGPHDESYCVVNPSALDFGSDSSDSTMNWWIRHVHTGRSDPSDVGGELPIRTGLAVHPNPFNPRTNISFSLVREGNVEIGVYNLVGQLVCTLVDRGFAGGHHSIDWDGRDGTGREVPSGGYIVRLETETNVETRKVSLLR